MKKLSALLRLPPWRLAVFCPRRLAPVATPCVLSILICLGLLPQGYALPTGAEVRAGRVDLSTVGNTLNVAQGSSAAIVNWRQFNIAPNELVHVLQNTKDAALLARVTGSDPSQLLGRLQAEGRVFLINPNGIVMGQGAIIDTAAFMASTLDVADADFLKGGPLTFKGDSAAGVVNLGKITAREGNVFLVAHTVKNAGEISAAHGTVGLGAGTQVYLASPEAPTFVIKANLADTTKKTGVDNSGVIAAAQAQLEAAGGSIYDLAINHSGSIQVNGVERLPDGRVLLTAAGGNVLVTGSATARNANGSGGEILVGGDFQGKNPAMANATNTQVGATAVLDASAAGATADGGRVIVWADNATRYIGRLSTRGGSAGGNGGFAEVSGKHSLGFAGAADLRAPAGQAGTLLLDPDSITVVAGAAQTLPGGLQLDTTWSFADEPGSQNITNGTINNYLLGNSLTLQANSSITVDAPINNGSGGDPAVVFTLQADTINLNAAITLQGTNPTLRFLKGNGATSLASAASAGLAARNIEITDIGAVNLTGKVTANQFTFGSTGGGSTFAASSLSVAHPDNVIANVSIGQVGPAAAFASSGVTDVRSSAAMTVSARIASATGSGNITFAAAGNLTMAADSSLVTGLGDVKLAATSGVFINQAAGNALLPAGNGGKYIYTTTTSGAYTLNGMTAFAEVPGVAFPDVTFGGGTRKVFVSGVLPLLTITADSLTKHYGDPDPLFTAHYGGGMASDLTLLPSFSILQGAHVNAGLYTIVPSGAASNTHGIDYINGTLTIDPALLTYVANPVGRTYRDANPAFTGIVTGFVNGDTQATAATGTLAFGSVATAASDAGSYAIEGSGLTANSGNYLFAQASGNATALTVNKATLTLIGANQTMVYGNTAPVLGYTVTGFLDGDGTFLPGVSAGRPFTSVTPVGTYGFGFESTGSSRNYQVTQVIPGTLTVTPAPLTLRGTNVTSIYGNTPPSLGYTVTGLKGLDTADVLTGVNIGTAFASNTTPGTYFYSFQNTGAAANYMVTEVVSGSLIVNKRPVTIAVQNTTSVAGVIPPFSSNASGALSLGGPSFTVQYAAYRVQSQPGGGQTLVPVTLSTSTPAGDYVIRPVVVPRAGTNQLDVTNAYDFKFVDATLRLNTPAVSPDALVNATSVTLNWQDTHVDGDVLNDNSKLADVSLKDASKGIDYTATGGGVRLKAGSTPILPTQLGAMAVELGKDFMANIPALLDGPMLTNVQKDLLRKLNSGGMSLEQFGALVQTDPDARVAVMPLLASAMMNKLASGQPLTDTQADFAARMATLIDNQRQLLKAELVKQLNEFKMEKIADTMGNQYALKTMPDIAKTAQQAATEQAIAAAIATGAGVVVGGTAGTIIAAVPGVAAAIIPYAGSAFMGGAKVAVGAGTGSGAAVGAGAAVAAVAVAVIVVGVVSAVMVVQEGENKQAYNDAMARASTPVDARLATLDLKNSDINKAEYFTAFISALAEVGYLGGKK